MIFSVQVNLLIFKLSIYLFVADLHTRWFVAKLLQNYICNLAELNALCVFLNVIMICTGWLNSLQVIMIKNLWYLEVKRSLHGGCIGICVINMWHFIKLLSMVIFSL